jgi:hypothetical protein
MAMPVHDWTRVDAGVFHDFHLGWIAELRKALNSGLLSSSYYALAEQVAGSVGPDVFVPETVPYIGKARRLVIRHGSDDRVVALLEILSPGNKRTRSAMGNFVDKTTAVLEQGYHLLLVDLFPPGPGDPQGVQGAVWASLGRGEYAAPLEKPLTLAAYQTDKPITAYVEPFAVGDTLTSLLLFLEPEWYVNVPLEATYMAAWEGVPARWRSVLEADL